MDSLSGIESFFWKRWGSSVRSTKSPGSEFCCLESVLTKTMRWSLSEVSVKCLWIICKTLKKNLKKKWKKNLLVVQGNFVSVIHRGNLSSHFFLPVHRGAQNSVVGYAQSRTVSLKATLKSHWNLDWNSSRSCWTWKGSSIQNRSSFWLPKGRKKNQYFFNFFFYFF